MQEYKKSLVVPQQPKRKLFMLCPVGLVGSGKTTVVKPLCEMLSLVRISGDEVRRLLKERGMGYEPLVPIAKALAEEFLAQGISVAIDSDSVSPRNRKVIADSQTKYSALPVWVHIAPPEKFILDKLRNFKHTWLFKDAEEAVANYEQRKPLHSNLDINFIYTFDTSRDDVALQIQEAAERIEKLVAS